MKTDHPLISVYIVSHNYGRYLSEAIESVLRQTVQNWELLIYDDNSSDNTAEIMQLYKGDHRIRLFKTEGIGLPSVCNLALKDAAGDFIIRLDGDDIFEENILLILGNYLNNNPECAMVFPDYYLIDEVGDIFAHETRTKVYEKDHVLDVPANGACCMLNKKLIKHLGGYREDLGAQDGFDLWRKIIKKHKVANVNLPLFYYRRHQKNLTNKHHHILSAKRRIMKDSIDESLHHIQPIIAIIPCRRNYDFCRNLWKRKINGQSLLEISIEKCLKSDLFTHVVVASDTDEVVETMDRYADNRLSFYRRASERTINSISIAATLEKIVRCFADKYNGISVLSYIQAPFVKYETLEEAIYTLVMNEADSAFGVEEIKQPIFKKDAFGLTEINPRKGHFTENETLYRESRTSLATRNQNLKVGSLNGPLVVNFVVSKDESFFIDSEQSLKIAQIIKKQQ